MARLPYILSSASKRGQVVIVKGDEARHLQTVLRFRTGDRFIGFDGKGKGWLTEVASMDKQSVHGRIIERLPEQSVVKPHISAAVGCIKGKRMDWAVEKTAEIGVNRFIPLITEFSVVDPGSGKLDHWRAIALSAAKQSRRFRVMSIDSPMTIEQLILSRQFDAVWVLHTGSDTLCLSGALKVYVDISNLLILIGPEGGFSTSEIELTDKAGFTKVTLGDHPLRTETAVTIATGMIANHKTNPSE